MLVISIPLVETFDDDTGEYFVTESFDLEFEHSLASLSKWESAYEKPFLSTEDKSTEEVLFYTHQCMLLTKNPPEEILQKLSKKHYEQIQAYIDKKHNATTINRPKTYGSRQIVTSAVIYAWMVSLGIPFETKHWHLNELLMLIDVCNEQKKPPRKMGRREAAQQQAALNAQRLAQMGTRG